MQPQVRPDGLDWTFGLPDGESLIVRYRDIRREKTGVHALVAVLLGESILAHDTFNIGRREDRARLAKDAHAMMGPVSKASMRREDLAHFIDLSALDTPRQWEENRIQIVRYSGREQVEDVEFAVEPYIIQGGGTIFFAAPGSGKSYLMQSMALSIATGGNAVWTVRMASPVLYVNLERDGQSMLRRELALRRALGLEGPLGVSYLHARGMSLPTVARAIKKWLESEYGQGGGVMIDSISRAGVGSLNEDETANRIIDTINGLNAQWWAAIGHTPRADSNHLFGSVHFDAGEDIGVKVASEVREKTVGIALEIVKANDIGHYPTQYIALEFDALNRPLSRIRAAKGSDFPDLLEQRKLPRLEQIKQFILLNGGQATPTDIANGIGMQAPHVSAALNDNPNVFKFIRKDGNSKYFGVIQIQP